MGRAVVGSLLLRCEDGLNEVPRESDLEQKLLNIYPSSLWLAQRAGRFGDNPIRDVQ